MTQNTNADTNVTDEIARNYSRNAIVNALRATKLTDATTKTTKRDALAMIDADEYVQSETLAMLALVDTDDDRRERAAQRDADAENAANADAAIADAENAASAAIDALTFDDVLAITDDIATLARVESSRVDVTVDTDDDDETQRVVFSRANRDALASAHVAIDANDAMRVTTRIAFADCVDRMHDTDVAKLDALRSHTDTRRSRVIVNADADTLRSIASVLTDAARNVFAAQNADTDALTIEDSQQIALRASHCFTLATLCERADVREHVANASSKRERSMRSIADALA